MRLDRPLAPAGSLRQFRATRDGRCMLPSDLCQLTSIDPQCQAIRPYGAT
jgi:hypothetical protein